MTDNDYEYTDAEVLELRDTILDVLTDINEDLKLLLDAAQSKVEKQTAKAALKRVRTLKAIFNEG